jgi:hypothetical protein
MSTADQQELLSACTVLFIRQWRHAAAAAHALIAYHACSDAAKAFLRHNGARRFGAQHSPVVLHFADAVPSCSRHAAAVSAEPSTFVWATREAVGDAESITDQLREAGVQLSHVHR